MVALAWCARGDGRALVDYLPEAYSRTLPSIETLQRLQDAITRLASLPLPPELRKLVRRRGSSLAQGTGGLAAGPAGPAERGWSCLLVAFLS